MITADRAIRASLFATLLAAPTLVQGQQVAGPGFRGYRGPNVYAPGFYSAYGYTIPRSTYRGPGFDLGTPSGNPGYNGGYPFDYRGYHGNFDYGYPAYYENYGYGWTPSPILGTVRQARPRLTTPRRVASPPRLIRIGR